MAARKAAAKKGRAAAPSPKPAEAPVNRDEDFPEEEVVKWGDRTVTLTTPSMSDVLPVMKTWQDTRDAIPPEEPDDGPVEADKRAIMFDEGFAELGIACVAMCLKGRQGDRRYAERVILRTGGPSRSPVVLAAIRLSGFTFAPEEGADPLD